MSWKFWKDKLGDEDVIAFGCSNAPPPSVAQIVAFTGVMLFGIAGMLVMLIRGNWSAASGLTVVLTAVLSAWPRGPFKRYRFADNREWALTKDGLYFENRAFIPAAALTRVGGFGGVLCFALQGKRHRRLSLAARRDKEPPPARSPARDDPRAEGCHRMTPTLFTNARLIDPEAGTDAPGWLLTAALTVVMVWVAV